MADRQDEYLYYGPSGKDVRHAGVQNNYPS